MSLHSIWKGQTINKMYCIVFQMLMSCAKEIKERKESGVVGSVILSRGFQEASLMLHLNLDTEMRGTWEQIRSKVGHLGVKLGKEKIDCKIKGPEVGHL